MSVAVFRCVSARHYRFEGNEKMGTHLIINDMKDIFQDTFENLNLFKLWYLFPCKEF